MILLKRIFKIYVVLVTVLSTLFIFLIGWAIIVEELRFSFWGQKQFSDGSKLFRIDRNSFDHSFVDAGGKKIIQAEIFDAFEIQNFIWGYKVWGSDSVFLYKMETKNVEWFGAGDFCHYVTNKGLQNDANISDYCYKYWLLR